MRRTWRGRRRDSRYLYGFLFQAQTAICIIQQFVAKYGSVESDVDLTQNKKRKKVLAGRINEYKNVLGDLILS